ncbi:hypothetical protein AB4254_11975 [Vibrio breoganii]
MWLNQLKKKSEFESKLVALQNQHPSGHIEDLVLFEAPELDTFYRYERANKPDGRVLHNIVAEDKASELAYEQVLGLVASCNDMTFRDLLRKERANLDKDEIVTLYKHYLSNPERAHEESGLTREALDLGHEFASEFKPELKAMMLNKPNAESVVAYSYLFGIDDLTDGELADTLKHNLSHYTLLLQYTKSVDMERVMNAYQQVFEAAPFEGVNAHLKSWNYVAHTDPSSTKRTQDLHKNFTRALIDSPELKKYFFEINERDLYPKLMTLGKNVSMRVELDKIDAVYTRQQKKKDRDSDLGLG